MDTKWKNSVKTYREGLWKHKKILAGLLAVAAGVVIFYALFRQFGMHSTRTVWIVGILANVPLVCGMAILMPAFLRRLYRSWIPENGDFYQDWRRKGKRQQRTLYAVFGSLFVLAVLFFSFQIRYGAFYYYYNMAMNYLLIATVVIQFAAAEVCVIRFMQERLNRMMEKVNEINRERLAEAVEIERKSLEKAARSEQLKVDLISNVSHDLKTPLTSMVGYLELLKKEDLNDVARDYADVISNKAEKLKEMIESLFSLAKASSGNIEVHLEPVELNRMIDQIFADLSDRIDHSGLHFVRLPAEEDTHLMTDHLLLYRICQNLIENALKYSAAGTRVFVKTYFAEETSGRRMYLEITNTAGYFMDFTKEDIVERFARGDKARSSDGNGLGLAIVSTYANALGGAFNISIDCDQFRAALSFPVEEEIRNAENPDASECAEKNAAEKTE